MELTAAIEALCAVKRACRVVVHTDSRYVRDAFAEGWLKRWQENGWRTSGRKEVENQDLWLELLALDATHEITWQWVRGHGDNVEHNRCDELAVLARALRAKLRR
jgi:ribonuclease HI